MTAATDTDFDRWLQTPADQITVDPNSAVLAANEWAFGNYGLGQPFDPITQFGFQPDGLDWSQPINRMADVDPKLIVTRRVFPASGYAGNVAGQPRGSVTATVIVGAQPSFASDAQISFQLPNGDWVNLWGYSAPWTLNPQVGQSRGVDLINDAALQLRGFLTRKPYYPFNPAVDLCAGSVEVIPAGSQGNVKLASPAAPMNYGVPEPRHAEASLIPFALAFAVSTLLCPPLGVPGAMPSNQGPNGIAGRTQVVPTAQRFRLYPPKVDLTAWLDSRHYTGALRGTAMTFGKALMDFGWFNAAYSGTKKNPNGPAMLCCDGSAAARDHWRALGITDPRTALHLLDGLIQPDAIEALTPPTGLLAKGGAATTTTGLVSSFGVPTKI